MSKMEHEIAQSEQLLFKTPTPAMQNIRHPSVQISTRTSWWNKRRKLEKRLLIVSVIAVIVAIVLFTILLVNSFSRTSQVGEVCITKKCIQSATNLLLSMNTQVDPCDDFYVYACGNWKKQHAVPDSLNLYNWAKEKTHATQRNIRDFLKQNHSDEPSAWTKAKTLYKSCLDTETLDSLELKPVFELLKIIGLQEMPPLPLLNATRNKTPLNWLAIAARAKKLLSIDIFVGFSLLPLLKSDVNNMLLGPPAEKYFVPGYLNSEENTEHLIASLTEDSRKYSTTGKEKRNITKNAHLEYRKDVLSYMYNKSADQVYIPALLTFILEYTPLEGLNTVYDIQVDDLKDMQQVTKATKNEMLWLKGYKNLTKIEDEQVAHISIDTLQNLTDSWSKGNIVDNWTEYFSILFEDINGVSINGSNMVILNSPKYIKNVINLISVTPRETVELLMWWKVVDAVAGHATTKLRQINEKYWKLSAGTETTDSRSIICTKVVMQTMSMAALSFSANADFLTSTKNSIEELYRNIKDAFISIIKSSTWLDDETKKLIFEKVEGIVVNTGYPKWLLDKEKLNEYYKEVETYEGQFLMTAANISRWRMEKILESLATGPLTDEYFINPSMINAYYNTFRHSITFLASYLQFPFYDFEHDALTYGSTAFTMGHELHHSFDTKGIMNKDGELGVWWNLPMIQEFLNRRKCFIKQYSKYGWDKLKVNGNMTVDEDMPDHGGLRISLLAYQKILKKKGSEFMLPGLTNYTSEQLFFLSFANFFCADMTEMGKSKSLLDVHTPLMFRVIGSVTNSEEFSRIWKCPKGTKMNPNEEKCKLW